MTGTENIVRILERLASGEIDVPAVLAACGGRQWYIPSQRRVQQAQTRVAIAADPCADARLVARRHHVSVSLVYEVWNERLGS